MENQVQTIVCPNCGASATNHHNCEYCGSFLVQRAAEGKDVSAYVQVAKSYANEGLTSALKLYSTLLQEHPTEKSLQFIAESRVTLIPNNFDKENQPNTGFSIYLNSASLEYNGVLGRFKNSPLVQAFNMDRGTGWDNNGQAIKVTEYKLDFGYDYEGASKAVLQLLELFGVNVEESTFVISDGGADLEDHIDMMGLSASDLTSYGLDSRDKDLSSECFVFNSNGVIIEDYVSFNQSGWQGIEERRKRRKEKFDTAFGVTNQPKKKGCAGMLAFLLAAGIGSTYGVVELIKAILA